MSLLHPHTFMDTLLSLMYIILDCQQYGTLSP